MIRLLLHLPIFLAIVLAVVWTGVLGLAPNPEEILSGGLETLAFAYPDSAEREFLLKDWGSLPSVVTDPLSHFGGRVSWVGRAGVLVTQLHLGVLVRLLPVFLLLVLSGVGSGLVFRERMRDAEGYASPTAAGVARALVGSGIFWIGLFAASPIPASYAWLYLAGIAMALGSSLYTANLPLKL